MKTLTCKITEETFLAIETASKQAGADSVSAWLRRIIEGELKRRHLPASVTIKPVRDPRRSYKIRRHLILAGE